MKKFTHKTAEKQGRMALRMRFMALLGLMFLFVAGMSLDAVAQKGNNMPTPVQKSCSLQRGNAQVNLTVKGQMPGTVKVQATPVQRSAVQGKQVKGAYDITLKDGKSEWQPKAGQPVMVTIADASFTDGEYLDVYHEGANGNEFVATVSPKNGQITFPARSFSVYIVTQAGDEARLKVKFYQNSQQVADDEPVEIYVKKKDIDNGHFNSVLYDPGVGTLEEGVTFLGWIKGNPNYTYDNVEPDAKTIAGVRTEIQSELEDGIQEGDEVAYYAMLFKTYIVSYYDGSPATLGSDNVTFRADATETEYSYTISKTYVPTSSEYNFMGWVVKDETPSTADNIVSTAPADGLYQFGDEITIKGNVNFSVDEEQGNWLVFDENGKGATYNAPQFVKNGDVTSAEDLLEMKRPGYEFVDWYTDQACTDGNVFEFGHELTERTTIYAKWTAHETAGYSVIVWMQKLTDQAVEGQPNSDYDFGQSFRVEDAQVGTQPTAVVGSTGATSITVDGNTVSEEGFHFVSTDQSSVTITPEGTSVVNVYMDRDVVTLNFHVWGYGDETYTATTSNSGTQYGLVDGEYVQLTRVTAYDGTFNDVYVWTYPTTTTTYTGTRYRYNGGLFGSGWTSGTGNDYNYGNINDGYMPLTQNGNTWTYSALPYTGTRYLRSQGTGWGDYLTISGRYGSTLAENSVAWPEEYDWYETGSNNGTASGTRTTFLDAFLPASTSTQVDFYGSTPAGNTHVYFYKQRPDRTGYDLANTVNTSASGFNLSDKYNGYKCTAWNSTNNTNNWNVVGEKMNQSGNWYYDANPNQSGYQTASISATTGLHIYFNVETYELDFLSGSTYYGNNGTNPETGAPTYGTYQETLSPEVLSTQPNVAYGANLADYQGYTPAESTWPDGYVFDGWFADDGCTTPYAFTSMPANNVALYAKWRQIRFRVFLHPNAYIETEDGDLVKDQTLDWGSETQAMNFGIAWGDKISAPTGRRDNYEFVGWFTDAAFQHPFNKDAFIMNNTNVPAEPEYDKNVDMTDVMDKWGEIVDEATAYNSDLARPWVQRKYDLYAQWRATVDGAIGIDVVYDDGDGSNAPTDQNHYLDAAVATAGAAATAPANKVFSHWVVQKYNCDEQQFEDTEITVYPGEKFTIHRNDALIEVSEWCDPLDDNPKVHPAARKEVEPTPCNNLTPPTDTYTVETGVDPETGEPITETRGYTKIYDAEYTIQLRAEYLDVEQPQPTFIIWFNNYEDAAEDVLRQDGNTGQEDDTHEELIVNHAVDIPTPEDRPGYKFLGWFKQRVEEGEDVEPVIEIAEDAELFLYYNEEDGKYYKEATFENEATQVAADEADPYDYLYAAWEQTCVVPEVEVEGVAVCAGKNATLEATITNQQDGVNYTYQWYTIDDSEQATEIEGASSATYTTTTAGTYGVIVKDANCESEIAPATVTINENPTVEVEDAEACEGSEATLTATTTATNVQYQWKNANGEIEGANQATYKTDVEGTYTIEITDGNGCKATDDAEVTINANPVLTVGELTQPTCTAKGQIPVTTTETKTNYTYYLGTAEKATQAATSYTYTGLDAGDYTVKVVDGNGCPSNEESVTLTLDQSEITFDPITMEVCSGYQFSETPDGADDEVTYTWAAPQCETGISDELYDEDFATVPQGTIKGKLVNTGNASGHAVYTVYPHLGVCNLDPVTVSVVVDATVRPEVSLNIDATSPVCADQGTLEVTAEVTNSVTESGYTLTWEWQGQSEDQPVETASATVTHEIDIPEVEEEKQFTLSLSYTDGVCTAETSTEITVQPLPTLEVTPATQTIYYGDAIEVVEVIANDYDNYAILTDGDLPDGVSYDQNTHTFSGTPKAAGTYTITVTLQGHEGIACDPVEKPFTIIVNKKNLTIELDSTKVYDGKKFDVTYQQLHVSGLLNTDHFAAGKLTTESNDPDVELSGIHVGEYETTEGFTFAPMEVVGSVVKAEDFKIENADGDDVTASYAPAFDVTLEITLRPITITSATETRPYNGEPLTNHTVEVTSDETPAIAETDQLADGTPTVTGSQLCLGTSDNTMSEDAIIMQGDVDVTADYDITYETGTLTVTEMDPADFVCHEAVEVLLKDCEVERVVTNEDLGEPTFNLEGTDYVLTNNLDELNPMTFGTYTVVWTLYPGQDCEDPVATCEQEVTIAYTPCGTMELDGYTYQTVRIGSQCWITENLRYETGTAVAYKEDDANVEKFGYLYTWYTAVGVPEDDDETAPETMTDDCGNEYVQGICPENWGIGSQADYDLLNSNAPVNLLKDPSTEYWQSQFVGDAEGNTNFSARGSGWYNSVKDRYEELMTNYHFWNADSTPGSAVNSEMISYYCDHIQTIMTRKSDKMSVRCVRKITPEQ